MGHIIDYDKCNYATMQLLLMTMFAGKETDNKLTSIGQGSMQAMRPRAILTSLQIGLAV